jgi:hypothetical protein
MGIGMGLVKKNCALFVTLWADYTRQLFVPAVSLPSHYFRAKRSLVMGMVFAGLTASIIFFGFVFS